MAEALEKCEAEASASDTDTAARKAAALAEANVIRQSQSAAAEAEVRREAAIARERRRTCARPTSAPSVQCSHYFSIVKVSKASHTLGRLQEEVNLDPAYWFMDAFLDPAVDRSSLVEEALAEANRVSSLNTAERTRKLRFGNATTLQQQLVAETKSLLEAHHGGFCKARLASCDRPLWSLPALTGVDDVSLVLQPSRRPWPRPPSRRLPPRFRYATAHCRNCNGALVENCRVLSLPSHQTAPFCPRL